MEIQSTGSTPSLLTGLSQKNLSPTDTTAPAQPAAPPVQVDNAKAVQQVTSVPSMAQLEQAVKNINKTLQAQDVEFSIDSESNRTIVKVVDRNTKEVLRQMPTQETLEIAKALDKVIGLLVRQKA